MTEHMKCVLCARQLECNQQRCLLFTVDASGGHFVNEEYIESYSKMYDGCIWTDVLAVLLVHVGFTQAHPNLFML